MKKEKYQKILIGITLIAILIGLKAPQIKADTVNYNYNKYRVEYYNLQNGTSAWTSWGDFNTSTPLASGYGISTIAVRFGYISNFQSGKLYRVTIELGISPQTAIENIDIGNVICAGSTSTSSWSNNTSLIEQCNFIGTTRVANTNHIKYTLEIITTTNIPGLQFNLQYVGTEEIAAVNVYKKSMIATGEDVTGAIEEQTIIIQETIQNSITEILDEDHEYTTEDITEEIEDLEQQEENIKNQLDMTIGDKLNIWWNTTYLNWIWSKAQNLILSNYYFTTIITSFMALGIIKLILGR